MLHYVMTHYYVSHYVVCAFIAKTECGSKSLEICLVEQPFDCILFRGRYQVLKCSKFTKLKFTNTNTNTDAMQCKIATQHRKK